MPTPLHFVIYRDLAGDFHWRLDQSDGIGLATSPQGYTDRDDCLRNLQDLRQIAPIARVEDLT